MMPRLPRSTERIKEEIARLHDQLRQAEDREAERLGRLAVKAGLHEIKGSDSAILEGMRDLARQFPGTAKSSSKRDITETGHD